ncbi:MAG: purine-nucleoside phosphorylase [Bacteroidales bacterium]|jgi:purine-nucleoside phosphorylase
MYTLDVYKKATEYIQQKINYPKVETAIIMGSGLGKLSSDFSDPIVIPYSEIPGFPVSTAPGHKGNLIYGNLNGKFVLGMQGRFHFYEGYSMDDVTFPIRVFSLLGVKKLFVTNAAGGINLDYMPGDLMIIKDHICLTQNPLIGKNIENFGPRFPDMTHPYSKLLISDAETTAKKLHIELKKGVYIGVTGPSYETIAEINFFRTIGADAVGMSTVPEVIVARHCNIEVLGVSVITNMATSEDGPLNDGEDVIVQADKASTKLIKLIKELV